MGDYNFITWWKVRDLSKKNSMSVRFERETLYQSLTRMGKDEEFAKRHDGAISEKVYNAMRRLGLLKLVRFVPAVFATPMIFEISHKDQM